MKSSSVDDMVILSDLGRNNGRGGKSSAGYEEEGNKFGGNSHNSNRSSSSSNSISSSGSCNNSSSNSDSKSSSSSSSRRRRSSALEESKDSASNSPSNLTSPQFNSNPFSESLMLKIRIPSPSDTLNFVSSPLEDEDGDALCIKLGDQVKDYRPCTPLSPTSHIMSPLAIALIGGFGYSSSSSNSSSTNSMNSRNNKVEEVGLDNMPCEEEKSASMSDCNSKLLSAANTDLDPVNAANDSTTSAFEAKRQKKWFLEESAFFPPDFSDTQLKQIPVSIESTWRFIWNDQTYSNSEWFACLKAWDARYPIIVANPSVAAETFLETSSYMKYQVEKSETRQFCYNKLQELPIQFCDLSLELLFRVDMFGNVVSLSAEAGSICAFTLTHLFPWYRGGRSVKENFEAVQSFASRNVKGYSKFLQSLTADEMQTGITTTQLNVLMKYARSLCDDRRQWQYERFKVCKWLTSNIVVANVEDSRVGESKETNFRAALCGSENGKSIYDFLNRHFTSE